MNFRRITIDFSTIKKSVVQNTLAQKPRPWKPRKRTDIGAGIKYEHNKDGDGYNIVNCLPVYSPVAIVDTLEDLLLLVGSTKAGFSNEKYKYPDRYVLEDVTVHKIDNFFGATQKKKQMKISPKIVGSRYRLYSLGFFMNVYFPIRTLYYPRFHESLKRAVRNYRGVKVENYIPKRFSYRPIEDLKIRGRLMYTNGKSQEVTHRISSHTIEIPPMDYGGSQTSIEFVKKSFVSLPLVY